MADSMISPSLPCMSHEAVAMAMDCGEIILPPVAPVVLAATSQLVSEPSIPKNVDWPVIPSWPATLACSFAKRMLDEVSEPVTNVPMAPINGAKKG